MSFRERDEGSGLWRPGGASATRARSGPDLHLRDRRPVLLYGYPRTGHLFATRRRKPLSQPTSFGVVQRAARYAGLRPHALCRAIATYLVRMKVLVPAVKAPSVTSG